MQTTRLVSQSYSVSGRVVARTRQGVTEHFDLHGGPLVMPSLTRAKTLL